MITNTTRMIDLKTGDIILIHTPWCWYKPVTYLSVLIRLFDKTYYNHCKLVIVLGSRPFITEALATGICLENADDNLNSKKIIVRRTKKPIADEKAYVEKALSYVGDCPYNFFALIQQFIYLTTGIWIRKKKGIKDFDCSQWDAYMSGFPDWWRYAPRDLLLSDEFETIYKN